MEKEKIQLTNMYEAQLKQLSNKHERETKALHEKYQLEIVQLCQDNCQDKVIKFHKNESVHQQEMRAIEVEKYKLISYVKTL